LRDDIFCCLKKFTYKLLSKKIVFTLFLFIVLVFKVEARYSISAFAPLNFCSTSYPTAYETRSFSISETTRNGPQGFTRNQSSNTLILTFNNANFQFNPGVGTVTASGTEVTIESVTISATQITVTISTNANNNELNTIFFNNIQIRATATASGYLRRSGGSFRVDNKTNKPSNTESWGNVAAEVALNYTNSSATQAVTTTVFTSSTNNQVIGVSVIISGTCSTMVATQLNFNTTGSTNPTNDIANARLYYTGTTNSFSTANLFGSIASPNGNFAINGFQNLTLGAGTYYFWLTYDVSDTALAGNVIDATFISVVLNGSTNNTASGNPAGSRTISDNVFYSINAGDWSTIGNWSRTDGGLSCGCAPTGGNGQVFISHNISLNLSYTVDNVTVRQNGYLTNAATRVLTVTNTLSTVDNGYFEATTAWSIAILELYGSASSTSTASITINRNMNIETGSTFQMLSGAGLTVNGNILVNGTLALGASNLTSSNVAGTIIDGVGTITGTGTITLGVDKVIPVDANLTIHPVLAISSNRTITNNGTVTMNNNITGGNGNSTWINAANSTLNMAGASSVLLATGTLNASALNNTVQYSGTGNQSIRTPSSSTYYNLVLSSVNSVTKSSVASFTVLGNLSIQGAASLNIGNSAHTITLSGNWINNSSNISPYIANSNTVIFNSNTLISGSATSSFHTIIIEDGALLTSHQNNGRVVITGNWTNRGDFNANSSDITFHGTSTVTYTADVTSTTTFNDVVINATRTLTLSADETEIGGDLIVNGTLNHNNGILTFVGAGNTQNVGGASSTLTLYAVQLLNADGEVILNRPLTINNSLTFGTGIITPSSTNILTLIAGSTTSSSNSNSFVNGPMDKIGNTAFVFPIGKAGRWARIGISAPSVTSTFRAEYFDGEYSNVTSIAEESNRLYNISTQEYWILDRNSGTGNASVTLYWENAEFSGIDNCTTEDLRVAKFDGTEWTNANDVVNITGSCDGPAAGSVQTSSPVTSFSPFTFGSKTWLNNPLPIVLTFFKVECKDNKNHIQFQTATEINNDYFTIEKSIDFVNWEAIETIEGKGNSNELNSYSTWDYSTKNSDEYFRLKQTDFDGKFTYSAVVLSKKCHNFGNEISIYPNPCDGNFYIDYQADNSLIKRIQIYNMLGETVYYSTIFKNYISLPEVPKGIYLITIQSQQSKYVQKLIIE
jgi:hypothetical protein